MFNLNLKIGIGKDGYNPLITVKINDSVTYTLEKETTTLKLVNREYKLTFSCPNIDNSGKLENTIIINPTSNNLDITIVPSSNGIQIKQHSNNIDNESTSGNFITKLWNNNNALIYITIALVVLFGIIFKNSMLLYVISLIICLGGGVFVSWMIGSDKGTGLPHLGRSLLIAFLFVLIIVLICSLASSAPNKDGDTCGICGGSGTVTTKFLGEGSGIQYGFDTYYRCKGCHGTGRD